MDIYADSRCIVENCHAAAVFDFRVIKGIGLSSIKITCRLEIRRLLINSGGFKKCDGLAINLGQVTEFNKIHSALFQTRT